MVSTSLSQSVEQALQHYFTVLDGAWPSDLYGLVLAEVEVPLLLSVLKQVNGNQCKAAQLLGISRGTLRTKLKQYQLDDRPFKPKKRRGFPLAE